MAVTYRAGSQVASGLLASLQIANRTANYGRIWPLVKVSIFAMFYAAVKRIDRSGVKPGWRALAGTLYGPGHGL